LEYNKISVQFIKGKKSCKQYPHRDTIYIIDIFGRLTKKSTNEPCGAE